MEVTKSAEALQEKASFGESASTQAVTRVNVEQASKRVMWEPTRLRFGEGRCRFGSNEQQNPTGPTGVVATACMKEEIVGNTGSLGGEDA